MVVKSLKVRMICSIIEEMASNQACTNYHWVSLPLLLSLFDFCPKCGSTCRISPISLSFVMLHLNVYHHIFYLAKFSYFTVLV